MSIIIIGWFGLSNNACAVTFTHYDSLWDQISHHYSLPSDTNQIDVRRQLYFYSRHPDIVEEFTENARPYIYYVYQQVLKRHMPAELALLPMIESDYKPFAYSSAGAVGLWQLMPGTASGFGVHMNWWYDGRRDTIIATKVALNYLSYLHQILNNNWLLAIAAYDAGAGTVLNAIRYNREHDRPIDFWSLPLPNETQLYVPRLLAIAYIIRYSHDYHIPLTPVPNQPLTEVVTIPKQMNLNTIANDAGVSLEEIRKLNPGFRRFATQPDQTAQLTLPIQHVEEFELKSQQHVKSDTQWEHYVVKSGDTLSSIAHQFKTSVTAVKKVNHLRHDTLSMHQALLIPKASTHPSTTSVNSRTRSEISEDHIPGPKSATYFVKSGDSLWTIAKKYHTTIPQILFWNNLSSHSTLHAGQKLTLWKKPSVSPVNTYKTYFVKSGDTLNKIAHRYKMTGKQLMALNHLKSSILQIKQKLLIP